MLFRSVVRDDLQVTEFQEGIVPWALQRPVALIFDEYDAGRPDVMFVIQRILERDGKFTLLDQNRVIHPHPYFRMFATTNTVGRSSSSHLLRKVRRKASATSPPKMAAFCDQVITVRGLITVDRSPFMKALRVRSATRTILETMSRPSGVR